MSPNAEKVIHEYQQLPPMDKMRVVDWIEDHKREITDQLSEEEREELFAQHLLDKGIIDAIPPHWDDDDDDFEPIELDGEPLSEQIIRERR